MRIAIHDGEIPRSAPGTCKTGPSGEDMGMEGGTGTGQNRVWELTTEIDVCCNAHPLNRQGQREHLANPDIFP